MKRVGEIKFSKAAGMQKNKDDNYFMTKAVKGNKNIFLKALARNKSLCIFALGFEATSFQS